MNDITYDMLTNGETHRDRLRALAEVVTEEQANEVLCMLADRINIPPLDEQMAIVALELSNAEVERANTEPASRQVMDINTLRNWLLALDIPNVTDIYQPNATNVFYVSFHKILFPDDYRKLRALGLTVEPTAIRARYMVTWRPPKDEEA